MEGIIERAKELVAQAPQGTRHAQAVSVGGWAIARLREAEGLELLPELLGALMEGMEANGLARENPKEAEGILRFLREKA